MTSGKNASIDKGKVEMSQIPNDIYHYTNLNSLSLILENQELWFTDIRFMNDSSELAFAHETFYKILKESFNDMYLRGSKALGVKPEEFVKKLTNSFHAEYYSASFSTKHDSLSMWRGYASPPSGVCIHFDRCRLINYLQSKFEPSAFEERLFNTLWSKTEYIKTNVGALDIFRIDPSISEIIARLCEFYVEYSSRDEIERDVFFEHQTESKTQIRKDLISFSLLRTGYKNSVFEEEAEVRFVIQPPIEGYLLHQLKFKVDKARLIPCYPVCVPDLKSYVTGLTIGPTVETELAVKSMEIFMRSHGINIKPEISTVPYRAW